MAADTRAGGQALAYLPRAPPLPERAHRWGWSPPPTCTRLPDALHPEAANPGAWGDLIESVTDQMKKAGADFSPVQNGQGRRAKGPLRLTPSQRKVTGVRQFSSRETLARGCRRRRVSSAGSGGRRASRG